MCWWNATCSLFPPSNVLFLFFVIICRHWTKILAKLSKQCLEILFYKYFNKYVCINHASQTCHQLSWSPPPICSHLFKCSLYIISLSRWFKRLYKQRKLLQIRNSFTTEGLKIHPHSLLSKTISQAKKLNNVITRKVSMLHRGLCTITVVTKDC